MNGNRFGVIELILRDVCEMERDDPDMQDTICIDISTLKRILDNRAGEVIEAMAVAIVEIEQLETNNTELLKALASTQSAQPASAAVPEGRRPTAYFTDFPGYRVYADKPHGWNEPGLILKDLPGSPIASYWEPLFSTPQPASAAVPEEWRLVPIEPTQEMISASMRVGLNTEWVYGIGDRTDGSEIYEAMLAAAPPPPAPAKPLPLTDEHVAHLYENSSDSFDFARRIEAAHNITGEPTP